MQSLYLPSLPTSERPFLIISTIPISSLLLPLLLLLLLLLLVFVLKQWCRRTDKRRLPPGSMGWPYIGETLKLYTEDPKTFFSTRRKRYGDVFKSHILGCPCVMISSPEAAKNVLVNQAHLFKPTYPPSKEKMIGPQALFFHQGNYHLKLKKLIQASFAPSVVKGSVSAIEEIVLNFLPTWENHTLICTLKEMKKYAFEVAIISAFGKNQELEMEGIKHFYQILEKGYNSMPMDFPGTLFNKAMKARKQLNEALTRLIKKRKGNKKLYNEGGLLGILMRAQEQKLNSLSDSQISDNIIGVIFAAHDTTATALTWLLKYLLDNPHILQAVTVVQEISPLTMEINLCSKSSCGPLLITTILQMEQEGIQCKLVEENRGLTWDDTRRMFLTSRVIQETLRTASILSFTFREAVEDVEFEGYIIPKGWKVLPLFRTIHHSADFFPQPEKFDPSRFEVPTRPHTYMPFGNGLHSCPGNELAKLEMLIFLHHFTTTYRWKVIGEEDGIEYGPFPVPKRGLPIEVRRKKYRV